MSPRREGKVTEQRIPFFPSAVVMSGWDRAALAMLAFGGVPLVVSWIRLFTQQSSNADWITHTILGLFAFAVIETLSMIFLRGLGRLELSDKSLHWLGAMALGEIAPMAWFIIKKFI